MNIRVAKYLLGGRFDPMFAGRYPFVNAVGHRLLDNLPAPVDLQDLVDIGIRTLPAVVSGHGLNGKTPFVTFVNHGLRGAMLDWIGEHGCVARDLRRMHASIGGSPDKQDTNDRTRAVR